MIETGAPPRNRSSRRCKDDQTAKNMPPVSPPRRRASRPFNEVAISYFKEPFAVSMIPARHRIVLPGILPDGSTGAGDGHFA
jgi:hypothetical protein